MTGALVALMVVAAVPVFRMVGRYGLDQARESLFIFGVILVAACPLNGSVALPGGPAGHAFVALVLYAAASWLWAASKSAAPKEVVRLVALALFMGLAQSAPRDMVLLAVFLPAVPMAVIALIQQLAGVEVLDERFFRRKKHRAQSFLGNPDHTGAYLMATTFIGLYLAGSLHPCLWLYSAVVLAGAMVTMRKAVYLGLVTGGAFLAGGQGVGILLAGMLGLAIGIAIVAIILRDDPRFRRSTLGNRMYMMRVAWSMWSTDIKTAILGRGPRAFRVLREIYGAQLLQKHPELADDREPRGLTTGRRVHCDYMETLVEYGVVGTLLAGAFVWHVVAGLDGLLAAAAIAVLFNALAFYPLRDMAVSLPFFALASVSGGTAPVELDLGFLESLALLGVAAGAAIQYGVNPILANYLDTRGLHQQANRLDPSSHYKLGMAQKAIKAGDVASAISPLVESLQLDGEKHGYKIIKALVGCLMTKGATTEWLKRLWGLALAINPEKIVEARNASRD